jgi:hypothetical protein
MAAKKNKLIIVHGDKGGVGKSVVAALYLDHAIKNGDEIIAIEADQRNPDVELYAKGHVTTINVDMSTSSGWISLLNTLGEHKGKDFVISLPAQAGQNLSEQGSKLCSAVEKLGLELIMLFPINRQKQSLIQLKHAINDLACADKVIVIKNGFFGEPDHFRRWQNSNLRKDLGITGDHADPQISGSVSEAYLPTLVKNVVDALEKDLKPYTMALEDLNLGEQAFLEEWLAAGHKIFEDL